jgi:hypothetical protein
MYFLFQKAKRKDFKLFSQKEMFEISLISFKHDSMYTSIIILHHRINMYDFYELVNKIKSNIIGYGGTCL